MQVPLHYQVTRHDCGPTTAVNALSFLLDREELPAPAVQHVWATMLDRPHGGTSANAMRFFAEWVCDIAAGWDVPLAAEHLRGDDVTLKGDSRIVACVEDGGCCIASTHLGCDHYVLLTGIERSGYGAITRVRLFDSWLQDQEGDPFAAGGDFDGASRDQIACVTDAPFSHNRIVDASLLDSPVQRPYSFVCDTPREATLLWRA